MNNYECIARIIRHLDASHTAQPDLAALAKLAGLSPHHFHRLFAAWAGITPKDFLQCLTLTHVKRLLRDGESVLDTALDAGLSGPGRLHDLCVGLEAVSPGEWKSGGEGMSMTAGFAECPFGIALIAESPRGICHLSFLDDEGRAAKRAEIQKEWPQARLQWDDAAATRLADRIFARPTDSHPRPGLRAFVQGTPFQIRVWRALLTVPPGTLVSYGHLAELVGNPKAARAVGSAVGSNSISYLIPCHRVIRETGVVGNYRWGHVRKQAILAWESSLAPR